MGTGIELEQRRLHAAKAVEPNLRSMHAGGVRRAEKDTAAKLPRRGITSSAAGR